MSENDIFRTMTKGTTKNSSNHRYGSATTSPRPVMPTRRSCPASVAALTGHHHRAGGIPRQVDQLIPAYRFGMARCVGLCNPHHLAGGQLDQVDRQVAEIGDVLHGAAH